MIGGLGRLSGGAVFLLLFAVAAVLLWQTIPPAVVTVEPPQAAKDFAQAWQSGELDRVSYDPASAPNVGEADAGQIAENVLWMVRGISAADADHPIAVSTVGEPREQVGDRGELLNGDLIQPLEVTWDLGDRLRWTYRTAVIVRETEGQERVVWRPSVVHPALTYGLVLTSRRLRPDRAPVLDATRRVVPATFAPVLIGRTATATQKLADTYPARVRLGDVVGISGLQQVYDTQLAGVAGVEIDVVQAKDYAPLLPPVSQVYVAPPVPGKPLLLSLDPVWQARAQAAVNGATTATALVAVNALTGEVLAEANSATGERDLALHGRYPPGSVFRLVTMLALARHLGLSTSAGLDCTPWAFQGQRFVNPATAPTSGAVDVATAFADNCTTGFARAASALNGDQLRDAGTALGIGLADATGASAFDGLIPPTDDDLLRVQNAVGEGAVLASPLVMARAAATVATGVARPSRLVLPLNGASTAEQAAEPALSGSEQATLQQLMALSVQTDEQLEPLRTASAGRVNAVAGTAGYGPAAGADSHAWCIGYQGSLAFAVFVAGDPATAATDVYRAQSAAQVAADFLG